MYFALMANYHHPLMSIRGRHINLPGLHCDPLSVLMFVFRYRCVARYSKVGVLFIFVLAVRHACFSKLFANMSILSKRYSYGCVLIGTVSRMLMKFAHLCVPCLGFKRSASRRLKPCTSVLPNTALVKAAVGKQNEQVDIYAVDPQQYQQALSELEE